jgi:hypothetical protein
VQYQQALDFFVLLLDTMLWYSNRPILLSFKLDYRQPRRL